MAEKVEKEIVGEINDLMTIDIPSDGKRQLMSLIIEEAMKSIVVQNFIKGLAAGLQLQGNYMLRYEDFKFVKQG